ncbi:MAG: AsmA family protein [Planctomycetes bacterium]|nr:AsmA family protein [Planctomycetota bacterium]MCH8212114.1 AsmA family protein [Planctomycetota bacterium]MCH8259716.1 AsmA family protein [Planctomycetota bacterium]
MKTLIKMVAVLLILLVLATVAVALYIDTIAKTAIERGATYALGVETTLGSADVGLWSGTFSMGDMTIANPAGFESPYFTHLGQGDVEVALKTLRQETVELPTLTLTDLEIYLDKKEGKANYDVILENLKRFESQENAQDDAGGKKFIIEEVLIKNIMVHVQLLPLGGDLTKLDVPIDEVRLHDVGSGTDGSVLMSELTSVIIKAVLAAIVQKGGGLIPSDILGDLGQGLGSLAEIGLDVATGLGDRIKDAGGGLDEVTEGLGDAIKSIGDGLGGLLGGDKKKDDGR